MPSVWCGLIYRACGRSPGACSAAFQASAAASYAGRERCSKRIMRRCKLASGSRLLHPAPAVMVALDGRTITAGAGCNNLEPLASLQRRIILFEHRSRPAYDAAALAWKAAEQAPGLRPQAR